MRPLDLLFFERTSEEFAPLYVQLADLLANGIMSQGGGKGGSNTESGISSLMTGILQDFLNDNQTDYSDKPKANLNWMIVDEEFKEVLSSNHKGALQVNVAAGNMKQLLVGLNNLTIRRNGWLYVYVVMKATKTFILMT